ncbi:ABC-type amino acid transport system, permease component (fragment) [anaerobic digester metagenome]|uniref:ABC-type amino acid transport system, permease component n=1 Tax=anaerobic digester metagenome TaxID=1263854 RepID=A0A485M698_9ZZZZ
MVGFLAINDLTRASQVITSRTMDPYLSIIITAVAYLVIGAVSGLLFKLVEREKHLRLADFKDELGE